MRWLKIVTYGFYISMILWVSGMVTSILIDNKIISLLFIGIPLAIYMFFTVLKIFIELRMTRKDGNNADY
jgi:hypothetical protein